MIVYTRSAASSYYRGRRADNSFSISNYNKQDVIWSWFSVGRRGRTQNSLAHTPMPRCTRCRDLVIPILYPIIYNAFPFLPPSIDRFIPLRYNKINSYYMSAEWRCMYGVLHTHEHTANRHIHPSLLVNIIFSTLSLIFSKLIKFSKD